MSKTSHKFNFTTDWFTGNISSWNTWLAPFRNNKTMMLEIGSFQGRSAIWSLQNILTHPESLIYCCDTFEGSREHNDNERHDLFNIFQNNIQPFSDKVIILKGYSSECLKAQDFSEKHREFFDIIYIDGDHRSRSVLEDAILAFPLLKSGGIMIFDDYMWKDIKSIDSPHIGINAFIQCYADDIEILEKSYQVYLRKK